ncbi:MAG TPA: hypothetical protein PLN86_11625 [Candidatus Hydrogenedentes bacterium]|nr:hypothetical protein [Candidatus Hydrogenedentota bacterium]
MSPEGFGSTAFSAVELEAPIVISVEAATVFNKKSRLETFGMP